MTTPRPGRLLRTATGGAVLAALYLPLHRLLDVGRGGPAAATTREVADRLQGVLHWGTLSVLLAALALALLVPWSPEGVVWRRARALLLRPPRRAFAAALGTLAAALGLAATTLLHRRLPRLLDEMAQLLHARAFAEGRLTVPSPIPEGRVVLNGVLLPEGWASVYPPGHTALLAMGHLAGAPWVVGPLLLGATAVFAFLAVDRLLPGRPGTARLAGVAVASSPFLVLLGSGYLSHVASAAALSAALYFAVRAWQGTAAAALPAGAAAAFALTARPWSGLVLRSFLTAGVWTLGWWREGRSAGWLLRRGAWASLGALPFLVALLAYDAALFGHPFRMGYELAFGPDHGLGLHPDPWGNLYGLREAVGYTGADLVALGLHLFETPLPGPALVGAFLLLVPRLSPSTAILSGWAVLGVLANAAYWHHGYHLGPRMLAESGPAWAALTAVAAVGLVEGCRDPGVRGGLERAWSRRLPASVILWTLVVTAFTTAARFVPARVETLRRDADELARSTPPEPAEEDALVFVHGSWAGRVASRLAAAGMRRDSVETALRRNGLCRVHLHVEARAASAPDGVLPPLDFGRLPGSPASLVTARVGGTPVRLEPGPLPEGCAREAFADRLGVIELAPLLWQTALPGAPDGVLLYRDLGPRTNREVLARFPGRTPLVYVPAADGGAPEVLSYERGMELLWGSPGSPGPSSGRVTPDGGGG